MPYTPRRQPSAATCPTCQMTMPVREFTTLRDGTRRAECRACLSAHFQRLHGRRRDRWALLHRKPITTAGAAA